MKCYSICLVSLFGLLVNGQQRCQTCQKQRRKAYDMTKLLDLNSTKVRENEEEIKMVLLEAVEQVKGVVQFTNVNLMLLEEDATLRSVGQAVDSVSLSFLAFLRELEATLDAIPIVGKVSSAVISVLQAIDDVYFDILDVILVFLRDDVLGFFLGADAVSGDAIIQHEWLDNLESFTDYFPPVGTLVDGISDAVGVMLNSTSGPAIVQQVVNGTKNMTPEMVMPIVTPLIVLESIVVGAGSKVACLLGVDVCGAQGEDLVRCNTRRFVCSVQDAVFGEKSPGIERAPENETETTEVEPSNSTEAAELGNATQTEPTNATEAELTNATQAEPTNATQAEPTNTTQAEPTNATEVEPTNATEAEPTSAIEAEPSNTTEP